MNTDLALRSELTTEAQQCIELVASFGTLDVVTTEDLEFASALLRDVKSRYKYLEDKRTSVTGPINKGLREINSWFKPVLDPLERAEAILKGKIGAYHQALSAKNAEAMKTASLAAIAGDGVASSAALATLVPHVASKGIGVREVWTYEILDESLVPRHLLSVDHAKIKAQIALADTATPPVPIPGVRIFIDTRIAVRT